MTYLLDTNVVSDWVKPRPNPGLAAWLHDADEDRLHLSVVTFAELRRGIERLPAGQRRSRLDDWLTTDLPLRFEDRVVPADAAVADRWGRIVAQRERAGRPIGAMDGWIAATAMATGFALVTRNAADFRDLDLDLLNPWSD